MLLGNDASGVVPNPRARHLEVQNAEFYARTSRSDLRARSILALTPGGGYLERPLRLSIVRQVRAESAVFLP